MAPLPQSTHKELKMDLGIGGGDGGGLVDLAVGATAAAVTFGALTNVLDDSLDRGRRRRDDYDDYDDDDYDDRPPARSSRRRAAPEPLAAPTAEVPVATASSGSDRAQRAAEDYYATLKREAPDFVEMRRIQENTRAGLMPSGDWFYPLVNLSVQFAERDYAKNGILPTDNLVISGDGDEASKQRRVMQAVSDLDAGELDDLEDKVALVKADFDGRGQLHELLEKWMSSSERSEVERDRAALERIQASATPKQVENITELRRRLNATLGALDYFQGELGRGSDLDLAAVGMDDVESRVSAQGAAATAKELQEKVQEAAMALGSFEAVASSVGVKAPDALWTGEQIYGEDVWDDVMDAAADDPKTLQLAAVPSGGSVDFGSNRMPARGKGTAEKMSREALNEVNGSMSPGTRVETHMAHQRKRYAEQG